MTKAHVPLTAWVVNRRKKRGGEFDGEDVLEFDRYYVRSAPGDRWEACRHGTVETPIKVTGEFVIVQVLGPSLKTPQEAARVMWRHARRWAERDNSWLVDEGQPESVRKGVHLMPLERAMAIHDAIVMIRAPTVSASEFLEAHASKTTGKRSAPRQWLILRDDEEVGTFVANDQAAAINLAVEAGAIRAGEKGITVVPTT